MVAPSIWLLTGSTGTIGLEYVRQIVGRGDIVFATGWHLEEVPELYELQKANPGLIEIIQLDVLELASIKSAAEIVGKYLKGRGLDYLINIAAILGNSDLQADTPSVTVAEKMVEVLKTNLLGAALVYKQFLPFIEKSQRSGGSVVVNISSLLGSISNVKEYEFDAMGVSYSVSKAGLNMLTVKEAAEKPNIIAISVAPGYVKTKKNPNAPLDANVSVKGQLKLITAATSADSGKFFYYDGTELPW